MSTEVCVLPPLSTYVRVLHGEGSTYGHGYFLAGICCHDRFVHWCSLFRGG